jgi:intracellular sulfur oxidation DsrE/DsrF family protein
MRKYTSATIMILALSFFLLGTVQGAGPPKDREALKGLKTGKVIFDVRVPDKEKLTFHLELIKETFEGMREQGVQPLMIVTFRGPGVKFLARDEAADWNGSLITELKAMGVRFEVCAVAARIFKVDTGALIPDVVLVGNVLTSLIGYQNKGYALIPMN